jgi:hypothetical protein
MFGNRSVTATFTCDGGFTWNGSSCTPISFVCTGTTPSNANLCSGDSTGLSADTPRTVVSSCTVGTKCEYTCDNGYTRSGNSCVPVNLTSDLTPTVNGTLTQGNTVSFDGRVRNNGGVTVSGFSNNFTYCWGSGCSPSTMIGSHLSQSSLNAGASRNNISANFNLSNTGTLRVQHCIDSRGQVTESNETYGDNCRVANFTVNAAPVPDYDLTITETGEAASAGTTVLNPGSNCVGNCTRPYSDGTSVNLSGSISNGQVTFSGSGCSGDTCTVSMTTNRSVTATYTCDSGFTWSGSSCDPIPVAPPDVSLDLVQVFEGSYNESTGLIENNDLRLRLSNESVTPVGAPQSIPYDVTEGPGGANITSGIIDVNSTINQSSLYNDPDNPSDLGSFPATQGLSIPVRVTLNPDSSIDGDTSNNTGQDVLNLDLTDPTYRVVPDLEVVRTGNNAAITVTVENPPFTLNCTLSGPGGIRLPGDPPGSGVTTYNIPPISASASDFTLDLIAGPLTSTAEYTLTCSHTSVLGNVFNFTPVTETIDVVPRIEEI